MTNKIKKYTNLFRNIKNWEEYIFHKSRYETRNLHFTTRPNELNFEVPGTLYVIYKEIFMEDFYEIRTLLNKLPHNPVIIDIGANAGYFSLIVLSKIKDAVIYAYEPFPSNIKRFKNMINANPLMQKNIHLFPKAVGGKANEVLQLYVENNERETSIASIYSSFDSRYSDSLEVESTDLASILSDNAIETVDLVKMDCEGSEYNIIYNTPDSVLQRITGFAIETHELQEEDHNHNALNLFLQSKGYATTLKLAPNKCFYLEAFRMH